MTHRIHRAWLVAGVTFLVLLASAAFRSSVGVMIVPFEDEFGWSRSATSLAVSVNLVLYGVLLILALRFMPNGLAGMINLDEWKGDFA